MLSKFGSRPEGLPERSDPRFLLMSSWADASAEMRHSPLEIHREVARFLFDPTRAATSKAETIEELDSLIEERFPKLHAAYSELQRAMDMLHGRHIYWRQIIEGEVIGIRPDGQTREGYQVHEIRRAPPTFEENEGIIVGGQAGVTTLLYDVGAWLEVCPDIELYPRGVFHNMFDMYAIEIS